MNENERMMDLALGDAQAEVTALRARVDKLEKVATAAKVMIGALTHMSEYDQWDKALTRLEKTLEGLS